MRERGFLSMIIIDILFYPVMAWQVETHKYPILIRFPLHPSSSQHIYPIPWWELRRDHRIPGWKSRISNWFSCMCNICTYIYMWLYEIICIWLYVYIDIHIYIWLCIYRYIHPISHAYVYTYVNTSLYTVPYDYNILLHRERYRYRRYMIMLMMVMVYYATGLFHLVILTRRCARSQLGDHQWAHHASIAARPGKGWSFWWEDMHIWFYMYIWTYVSMYICVYIHTYIYIILYICVFVSYISI